ncbi:HNH endonuclease [Maritalea mediterranea]|uniref:HNH endonuclease n=1 Tax=Maritalea mediterranea TaxID=2909667 RepID=UPI001F3B3115|nr:HNH endonuclease [Maritalea mediterranea]
MARDYKKEYAASRRPDRRRANIMRKRHRRLMIKKYGAAALRGKEVDHKNHNTSQGGKNLQILTIRANRKKQPKRKK